MRNLKNVIFVVVLTTLALSPCALAKSPLLLLQEGIYAEETEGDLDKAIGLYEQVIDHACEVERIAAKAAYKLGGCYLKKDDKESAAKYFQSVVEKYPSQTAYFNQAKEQLEKIAPEEKELPLFAQVPSDVLGYLSGQYAVIAAEGNMKNLKFNNHIYYVSPELKFFRGGYGYYQQPANSSTPERICFNGTTYTDLSFYDVIGNEMKVEIEDRPGRPGYYDIYWKPTVEIPAGQPFYYGWCRNKSIKLNPIANRNAYPVTMQNQYGSPVLEVFFLVLPEGFAVAEQSETFTKKETVAGFDIYQWKKEVPASTKHMVNITLKKETFAKKIQVYKVDKSAADFADDDFSTPESAYAAINKVSASGKAEGWKKASVPSLADRLPGKDSSVPEDWAEVLRNAKIAEVRIYDNKYAQVTAKLLSEFSSKEIRKPFDVRHLELVNGKWLNTGNDRRNSLEETAELFEKVVQRKTEQPQPAELNPFNDLNQPYTIWFRPMNKSVKDRKGLLDLFNSIVNFDIKTYKFRTETQGQGIIGLICTDGKDGKDKIVELLNKNKEVNFIKTTTPYVISFKANDPKDAESAEGLLNTFNRSHPEDVATHHFKTTAQQGQLIGHICTNTIREKNKIVTAIEKSSTMVLVGTTEPLEKQESIKPQTTFEDENKAKIEAAVKSASDWLDMIDNASYDQSWKAAASFFKSAVTQSQWEFVAKAAREPVGKLISREVLTKTYTKQVPGGPDGQYVVITFKASFENKKDAIETVTPMLDNDGKWKVSGYYIK